MKQPAILIVSLGVVGGVAAGSWFPVSALIVGALLLVGTRYVEGGGLLAAGVAFGLARIVLQPLTPGPHDLSRASGAVAVDGTVVGQPQTKDNGQQVVVRGTSGPYRGRVLVKLPRRPELAPGDRVTVEAKLTRPPRFNGFDYRSYLAKDGIHAMMRPARLTARHSGGSLDGWLYQQRRDWQSRLTAATPQPAGGFLQGILFGDRSQLSDSLQQAFQRTGTTHVLALSGFNVTILVATLIAVLGRRPAAIVAALLVVGIFVLMVGPSASVVRAALMGGFLLLGQALGRPQAARRGVLISAAVMLLFKPWSMRYDLGFDLSFLATLGILFGEEPIRARLGWLPGPVAGVVDTTLAAGLATLPLLAVSFGRISLISPLANLVLVPAVAWLMLGGTLILAASYLAPGFSAALGASLGAVTNGLLWLIQRMAVWPFASVSVDGWSGRAWIGVALLLGLVLAWQIRRRVFVGRWRPV